MTKEEKLYEVLGELLYAIAKADGVIQSAEKKALTDLLKNHPNSSGIIWSFEYEVSKETSIDEIYKKVINYCHSYGPSPIYNEFIEAMHVLAEASEGLHEKESKIIESFSKDLLDRFRSDAERLRD